MAEVHGASGLDGFDLTGVDAQLTGDAADRIRQAIEATPLNVLTLLTTGPLTNIAQALIKNPLLLSRLKETVIMGGAIAVPGNQNRVAEFNICVDPHAADIVFSAPGRKILIPLDVCNDVLIQMRDLDHLPQTKTIRQVRSMLEPYIRNIKQFIGVDGALMYDPIAAFYTLSPESFVIKAMDIRVETRGDLTTGMTVTENRSTIKRNENIFVATELDVDAFLQTFFNSLQKLP